MLGRIGMVAAWIAALVILIGIASAAAKLGNPNAPPGPCQVEFFTDC